MAHAAPELRQCQPYGPAVDVWGLGFILDRFYPKNSAKEASQHMADAKTKLMETNVAQRWTLEQLKNSPWIRRSLQEQAPPSPMHRLGPLASAQSLRECSMHPQLGQIFRFSRCHQAYIITIPDDCQHVSKKLMDLPINGNVWNAMFVQSHETKAFVAANADSQIRKKDRIVFGASSKDLAQVLNVFGIPDGSQGHHIFWVELDCFEFTTDLVGTQGKVLGVSAHANEALGASRATDFLDFRRQYRLNLIGIAIRHQEEGYKNVTWAPPPTFEVKAGYLGIVPRVPQIHGRTVRETSFGSRPNGPVPW